MLSILGLGEELQELEGECLQAEGNKLGDIAKRTTQISIQMDKILMNETQKPTFGVKEPGATSTLENVE